MFNKCLGLVVSIFWSQIIDYWTMLAQVMKNDSILCDKVYKIY